MMQRRLPGSDDSTERRAAILPRWAQLLVECAIAIAVLTIATGLVGLVVLGVVQASAAERFEGQSEIVDADTFRISGTKIRLWGVDAPESGQTCLNAAGKRYLCGSQAALALADWIGRQRMTCEQRDTDAYKRPVVSCTVAGEDVAGWLAPPRLGARFHPLQPRCLCASGTASP